MSEDLLDDLINSPEATIQKWTERVVSGRVGDLERRLHENSTENAQLRVQVALDRDPELAGKWRVLNNDKAFIDWLGEVDGFSGAPRQHLLTRAYNTGYSDRVAAIFKAFIAQQTPARERTQARLPHEGTGPQPTIRTADLTRGKIWSKAEIHAFIEIAGAACMTSESLRDCRSSRKYSRRRSKAA